MGTTEIVHAVLKGMGQQAECRLMVTRTDLSLASGSTYTRCAILEAPDLPDGYYEAGFHGYSAFLHRANGCWSLGVPWPANPPCRSTLPPSRDCFQPD